MLKYKLILFINIFTQCLSSQFLDLSNGHIKEFGPESVKSISFAKYICSLNEDHALHLSFQNQTQKLIDKEIALRQLCDISKSTNVAQLCIYSFYDNNDCEITELFDSKSCRGTFYLSGNNPVSFSQGKGLATAYIDNQKISYEKGYLSIKQRFQPLLSTIKETILFFSQQYRDYIENPSQDMQHLSQIALEKQNQISSLSRTILDIIDELKQEQAFLDKAENNLYYVRSFTKNVLNEIIDCLSVDDLNFHAVNQVGKNKNTQELIENLKKDILERVLYQLDQSEKKQQYGPKDLEELLTSKHFNLGCSEPLLLFELNNELVQVDIADQIIKKLKTKKNHLKDIVFQVHSTKTPCKSCLINFCGHLRDNQGTISSLFSKIRKEFDTKKLNHPNLQFIVSYHEVYKDSYPFYIPITLNFILDEPKILLINMQNYSEQIQDIKKITVLNEKNKVAQLIHQMRKSNKAIEAQDLARIMNLTEEDIDAFN